MIAEQRENLVGGRQFSATTTSAPISVELRSWVEQFLDIHLIEVYGSTEDSVVLVDGRIARPPVSDYNWSTCGSGPLRHRSPHPRGELLVRSRDVIPGYSNGPK